MRRKIEILTIVCARPGSWATRLRHRAAMGTHRLFIERANIRLPEFDELLHVGIELREVVGREIHPIAEVETEPTEHRAESRRRTPCPRSSGSYVHAQIARPPGVDAMPKLRQIEVACPMWR